MVLVQTPVALLFCLDLFCSRHCTNHPLNLSNYLLIMSQRALVLGMVSQFLALVDRPIP